MALIRIVDGDKPIQELSNNYRVVTNFDEKDPNALYAFVTAPFDGEYHDKVIDASANKVPITFIKWVIQHSIYPVIIFFNGDKPAGLTKSSIKTENTIENVAGIVAKKEALFSIMDAVLYHADRKEVYDRLQKNQSLHFILFKWLICNVDKYEQNRVVLANIDQTAMLKNSDSVSEMLAFSFKPIYSRVRMAWKFPKKDE